MMSLMTDEAAEGTMIRDNDGLPALERVNMLAQHNGKAVCERWGENQKNPCLPPATPRPRRRVGHRARHHLGLYVPPFRRSRAAGQPTST